MEVTVPSPPPGGMGRATALVSGAIMLSRVLGLLREQAFAALLGAGLYGDAYTMAFRLPNLLRDLFAEGALSGAFQPAFQLQHKSGGPQAAQALADRVATALLILVGLLTVLGVVFAPSLVDTWAQGFHQTAGKAELTVLLTRIMMPFLLLVSLAAVCMGMLNAQERFLWPALAPALFNLVAILGGLALWLSGAGRSRGAAIGWAVATLIGGVVQLLCQGLPLWRSGQRFRLRFSPRDPALQKVLLAMAPATVGLMATQVNIYISSSFAAREDGAVTWLNVAFRLLQLPIGVFGVAVGTVALSRAARSLAGGELEKGQDPQALATALQQVRETLQGGLRMVAFLTLPSMVGLWLLAEPIIGLLFQHGAFHQKDTLAAAAALRCYSVGLLFYAAVKVVAPVFYALRRARVAVVASVAAVACNAAVNLLLYPRYGYRLLALGTSVAAVVNLGWLVLIFQRRYGGLLGGDLLLALLRMGVATLAMIAGLQGAQALLQPALLALGPHGHAAALCELVVAGGIGLGIYGGASVLLRVEEAQALGQRLGALQRRLLGSVARLRGR